MLKKFLLLLLLLPCLTWAQQRRYAVSKSAMEKVISGMIAVKLNAPSSDARTEGFNLAAIDGIQEVNPLRKIRGNQRSEPSILDGIYLVKIDESISPIAFCNQLLKHAEVQYAEAIFQEELLHTPNDPAAQTGTGSQGYLSVIKAFEAWDITKGSEDIVIGIIDTGADLAHEDLAGKYYQNFGEAPIANGIDEDGNGYIDDILGYDFADDDNNPQADGSQHGTHVSGIAGASTNNGLGIAGVGYNTKIAPLKGFTTVGTISTGVWEAVIYAADNGYDVANLSWGAFGNYSQVFQDVITYCVLEKDMVVIAAAGNTNADLDFYPASYEHVLSVAGTTLTDVKWNNSTYSDFVDITAPALSIYSTQNGDTYNSDNGTSHAAPQVAGVAALVKSVFPQYNARQIMEQVRVTTDNIYNVAGNEAFAFKLGKGRLNAFRAVTENSTRSLRVQNFNYSNGFGQYAFYGDTLTLSFDLTNYLAGLNSPTISMTSNSPYLTVLSPSLKPGAFTTMQTKNIAQVQVVINENTPINTELGLRFLMGEGAYSDFQNISIYTEPNELIFGNSLISLNIIGDGSLGYSDDSYMEGFDMEYANSPVLKFGGLMLASSPSNVQDNVTNDFLTNTRDVDFQSEKNIKLYSNDVIPKYGYSEFSSQDGNYWIEQSIIPSESNGTLIFSYRIVNTSGSTINNLSAGFFADYFLGNPLENHAEWDTNLNALVFKDDLQNTFAALQLLEATYHHMALDMQTANGHIRDVQNTFTDADKHALLTALDKSTAGAIGTGNDVAGLVSVGRPSLGFDEELRLAVVLSLADDYASLEANLAEAESQHDSFLQNPQTLETFFSCEGNDVIVNPSSGSQFQFYEDALGTISLGTSDQILVANIGRDTSVFVRNVDGTFPTAINQLRVKIINQVADFNSSADTLYLDHPTVNTITFTDNSFRPVSWSWDFDDGSGASVQNPVVNFQAAGNYDVTLTVTSEIGCVDFITKKIVVANRPTAPILSSIDLCRDEVFALDHPSDEYVVYSSTGVLLDKGNSVNIGPFPSTTNIKISQVIGGFESLPTIVAVNINDLAATYYVTPDLTSNENRAIFTYTGGSVTAIEWKINDQVVSTSESFSHAVDGSNIALELNVENESCQDQLIEVINFTQSAIPGVSNYAVCVSDDVTIKPNNGTYFGFYSDAQLTNLILKGTELNLSNLSVSQTIYVVGLDDILPSDPVSMSVDLLDFEVDILPNPPLLDLSNSSTVRLSSSNTEITSAKWYIDNQLVDQTLAPTLLLSTPGSYQIRLEATNSDGCMNSSEITYLVVSGITGLSNELNDFIYPNPVKRGDIISINISNDNASLYDLAGRRIPDFKAFNGIARIPLSLKAGVYILLVDRMERTHAVKLIID